MSEWKETTLGAVCENKSITYNFSNKERVIFINTGDVLDGKFLHHEYTEISSLPGQAKKSIVKNDILFSEIRPINRRFAFINFSCLDYVVSTKFMVVKAYQNLIIPKYLYTYLTNQDLLNTFQSIAESRSGTFPQITFDSIKHLDLNLPPLEEQGRIVDIASCLNAKIDNLRRQNETLEQIAQTLFKHWFVDFEFPNAEGKPYKSSGGAMFASELGGIPEGWQVTTIEKIASRLAMSPFGSRITTDNFVDSGIPIIRGNNLVNGFNEDGFVYLTPEKADELKSSNVFPEDIVFTHRGTLGQVGFIPTNARYPRYVVSQSQMFLSVNKSLASSRFIYRFFSSKIGIDALLANKNTTGVPSIARPSTSLKAIQIVLPENKIMERFDALITSIDFKKDSNTKQIQTLTKTRDSLLPKLMSGQLRVKE